MILAIGTTLLTIQLVDIQSIMECFDMQNNCMWMQVKFQGHATIVPIA
jgi:hypothetical protein